MKLLRLSILISVLCLLAFAFLGAAPEPPAPKLAGVSLKQFVAFDLDGRRHDLAEVESGRVVVIFWAYWCDTWKAALPDVKALVAQQEELDCTVWTVSVDGTYTEEIRPLVNAGDIPFPVLLDDGAWTRKLALRRVPSVMVLDKERKVTWFREAYPGNLKLIEAIKGLRKDNEK